MPPLYGYVCQSTYFGCPYCGDAKGSPEGDYKGCCGESSAHWTDLPCEHEYEVFYSSIPRAEAEEGDEVCPKCGGKDKKRLISTGTSHTLKGKGWFYNGGY